MLYNLNVKEVPYYYIIILVYNVISMLNVCINYIINRYSI